MPANSSLASTPPIKRQEACKSASGLSQFHGTLRPSILFLSVAQWITDKLNLKNLADISWAMNPVNLLSCCCLGSAESLLEYNARG